MTERVVIVGGGHAGGQAAIWLRQYGFEGEIDLVCGENWHPYQRPPLSKQVLDGSMKPKRCLFRPVDFYSDKDITVRLATRVTEVDASGKNVSLDSGESLGWDHLILATGSKLIHLPVPGTDLRGVFYLRQMDDSLAIGQASAEATSAVIVGGGYIGLEIASSLRSRGLDVTVVELAPRLLQRAVPPMVSELIQSLHEANGVKFHLGARVTSILGKTVVAGLELDDGTPIEADMVVIGIGVQPEVSLAQSIGAEVLGGIVVDPSCRTSLEGVFAIGDCTVFDHRVFGENVHLESVQHAVGQAKVVAQVLTGTPAAYDEVPWFWSDQHGKKLQIAGLMGKDDNLVVRGQTGIGDFSAFAMRDDIVQAVYAMGRPKDYLAGRQLIAAQQPVSARALSDTAVDLKALAANPS